MSLFDCCLDEVGSSAISVTFSTLDSVTLTAKNKTIERDRILAQQAGSGRDNHAHNMRWIKTYFIRSLVQQYREKREI